MDDFPNSFGFSVSHTSRPPRPGEIDGVHYHFSNRDTMAKEIADGLFLEHADVHGKFYGTSFKSVEDVANAGKVCILDIDIQGAQSVKESSLEPHYIFIEPPSMEVLEKRLRGRGTESEEQVAMRLKQANAEMDYGSVPGNFEINIVNNDLDVAYDELVGSLRGWYPSLEELAAGTNAGISE